MTAKAQHIKRNLKAARGQLYGDMQARDKARDNLTAAATAFTAAEARATQSAADVKTLTVILRAALSARPEV